MKSKYNEMELLETIQKVDAPPFLLTRIHAQIDREQQVKLNMKQVWSLGISFAVLLLINVAVISTQVSVENEELTLIETMNLLPTTNIY